MSHRKSLHAERQVQQRRPAEPRLRETDKRAAVCCGGLKLIIASEGRVEACLTYCLAVENGRPDKFDVPEGSGRTLLKLERVKK